MFRSVYFVCLVFSCTVESSVFLPFSGLICPVLSWSCPCFALSLTVLSCPVLSVSLMMTTSNHCRFIPVHLCSKSTVLHNNVTGHIYHHTVALSSVSSKPRLTQTAVRAPCILTVSIYVTEGVRQVTFINV